MRRKRAEPKPINNHDEARKNRDKLAIMVCGTPHNMAKNRAHYQKTLANALHAKVENEPDDKYRAILLSHAEQLQHGAKSNILDAKSIEDLSEEYIPKLTKEVEVWHGLVESLSPTKFDRNGWKTNIKDGSVTSFLAKRG